MRHQPTYEERQRQSASNRRDGRRGDQMRHTDYYPRRSTWLVTVRSTIVLFLFINERELKSSGDRSRLGSRYSAPAVNTIVGYWRARRKSGQSRQMLIAGCCCLEFSLPRAWNHNNERFKGNEAFQPVNVRWRCLGKDLEVDFGKIQRRKRISRAIDCGFNARKNPCKLALVRKS